MCNFINKNSKNYLSPIYFDFICINRLFCKKWWNFAYF